MGVVKERLGSNRCVAFAVSVAEKRRPTNCRISVCGHRAKERRGTYRRIELAVPVALKRKPPNRRVVNASRKAQQGVLPLCRVVSGIASVRWRNNRLRALHRGKADNQDCDQKLWHGCFHSRYS